MLILIDVCRWPFWKQTRTCWDSLLLSPSCTASSSFSPSKTVWSVYNNQRIVRTVSVCPPASTHHHLFLRYPILEQQTVSRGPVCALHHIWSFSVSGGAAVHTGQRNKLCGAGQRLHRPSYWSVENHQGHGRQSKSELRLFFHAQYLFWASVP